MCTKILKNIQSLTLSIPQNIHNITISTYQIHRTSSPPQSTYLHPSDRVNAARTFSNTTCRTYSHSFFLFPFFLLPMISLLLTYPILFSLTPSLLTYLLPLSSTTTIITTESNGECKGVGQEKRG